MKQVNQIGRYTKKDEVFLAKKGKKFVTPQNREYIFDFDKEGRKYIIIINYLGRRFRMNESDFNRSDIDKILDLIEDSLKITD